MFPIVVLGGTLVNLLSTRDLQLFATSASVHNIPYNGRLSVSITRFRGTSYWFVMLRHDRIRQATAVAPGPDPSVGRWRAQAQAAGGPRTGCFFHPEKTGKARLESVSRSKVGPESRDEDDSGSIAQEDPLSIRSMPLGKRTRAVSRPES